MDRLSKAIILATVAHDKQTDKSGESYILHPLRVMLAGKTEAEQIVSILHDVIEDSEICIEYLTEEIDLTDEESKALVAITRSDETYIDYIKRVKNDNLARRVKIADLKDNLSRSENISEYLIRRYTYALQVLE
jgi:(p)ppGpp synthase/HD superfamily hydrolase